MYLSQIYSKIQEIFPLRLANLINKFVLSDSFVCCELASLSGNSYILKLKSTNIYSSYDNLFWLF